MSDIVQKHMEYIIEKLDGAFAPMMDEDTREDLVLLQVEDSFIWMLRVNIYNSGGKEPKITYVRIIRFIEF